jgi:hypothetical protein
MTGSFFRILEAAIVNAAECRADSIVVEVSSDGMDAGCFVSDNREDFDKPLDPALGESVIASGGEWDCLSNPEFGGSLRFTANSSRASRWRRICRERSGRAAAKVFDGSYGEKTVMLGRTSGKGSYTILL